MSFIRSAIVTSSSSLTFEDDYGRLATSVFKGVVTYLLFFVGSAFGVLVIPSCDTQCVIVSPHSITVKMLVDAVGSKSK